MIVFKLPFYNEILTVKHSSNKQYPVEFFGFDNGYSIPFQGMVSSYNPTKTLSTSSLAFGTESISKLDESVYKNTVNKIIKFIKKENIPKLVFSRQKIIEGFTDIDLITSFNQLCSAYDNAFVYLFQEGDNCWMGAFSELLGKYDHTMGKFETMSLAGTLPLNEEWTSKEIEEQKTVTSYINTILAKYNSVTISKTTDHISGNIKHLRTDLSCNISPEKVNQLIQELHPTPAVCGIPKRICKKAINDFELYDRKLYSGYTKVENDGISYYFVNLRCAQFFSNRAIVYVGGGITHDSNAHKEWIETELKSRAIIDHLIIS